MRGVAVLTRQLFLNGVALCIAFAGALCPPNVVAQAGRSAPGDSTYDVVIVNGKVVDGSGNPWFFGDVAIRGDRVVRVVRRGMLGNTPARRRIDATGKVVAPGFIDIQAGGPYLAGDGRDVSKLVQGVTTEIMGEGYTSAPISDLSLADLAASGPAAVASAKRFQGPHGFDAWLRAMEAHGVSPNVGAFVGASTLREYGMGLRMGAATGAPLDSMRVALRNAMEDGAFGLGSALIYPPGNFASTEELIEVAKAMAPYGGLYITHMRSEADQVLEGIDEALRIGREAGVPVDIYHLKAAGIKNWPKAAGDDRKDRFGAYRRPRCAGNDVSVHGWRHRAGCMPASLCVGRREADAEPRRSRGARAHSCRGGPSNELLGEPLRATRRRRACCSAECATRRTSNGRTSVSRRSSRGQRRTGWTRSWICCSPSEATSARSTS